uniref:Peptidase S1 domain-containing protein n=1 Tax=Periophthalmus magnuspinnatus TaxID=409849 RepID=A0A3B4B834_9GOBI
MKHLSPICSLVCCVLAACGQPFLRPRIVGGIDAAPGSWPWIVSLSTSEKYHNHFCGGTLITDEWVLTAAHCMIPEGERGEREESEGGREREGEGGESPTRCHPEYNTTGKMENDICLLRLSAPVHFMPHIQPMCLAAQGSTFPSGFSSWVAGWGVMDEAEDVADTLQEVELPIVGLNECRCLNEISIPDKTICAGFKEGGRDSCSGDSGGPLIVQLNSIWVQVGVVSFGQGCAHANLPGAYALVPEYQKWISLMVGSSSEPSFVLFAPPDRDYDEEYVCQKKMTTTLDDDSSESDEITFLYICTFILLTIWVFL